MATVIKILDDATGEPTGQFYGAIEGDLFESYTDSLTEDNGWVRVSIKQADFASLIRNRAKANLYMDVIMDADNYAKCNQRAEEALTYLRGKSAVRGSGRVARGPRRRHGVARLCHPNGKEPVSPRFHNGGDAPINGHRY
jgi:hypothetical protein